MRRQFFLGTLPICIAICFGSSWLASGGVLDPPAGPVTSTGRFGNGVDVATLPSGSGATYVISQPGSYYLSGNLTIGSGSGIRIEASNVVLDLNGFTLFGGPGTISGVMATAGAENTVIRNGIVRDFEHNGLAAGGLIEDLVVIGNGRWGITASGTVGHVIRRCIAKGNGILLADRGGIAVSGPSTIVDCVCYQNTGAGIQSSDPSSAILRCASYSNTVLDYSATGCLVRGCSGSSATAALGTEIDNHGI